MTTRVDLQARKGLAQEVELTLVLAEKLQWVDAQYVEYYLAFRQGFLSFFCE